MVSAVIVTEQTGTVPEHPPPDHPTKGTPASGVAVSFTTVPEANAVPDGFDTTVPLPLAFSTSLKVEAGGGATGPVNVAVTAVSAVIVKVQDKPEPTQGPVQLLRDCPAPGVAVSVTTVPLRMAPVLAGLEVSVPVPLVRSVSR